MDTCQPRDQRTCILSRILSTCQHGLDVYEAATVKKPSQINQKMTFRPPMQRYMYDALETFETHLRTPH